MNWVKFLPSMFVIFIIACGASGTAIQATAPSPTLAPTVTKFPTTTPVPTNTTRPTIPAAKVTDTPVGPLIPIIVNAHMSRDAADTKQTSVFSLSDKTFYCFFDLKNAPESTVVTGVWILVSAEGYAANSEIDSAEVTGSDDSYYFSLDRSPSINAWPFGRYRIDLYIDGTQAQTVNFEVR